MVLKNDKTGFFSKVIYERIDREKEKESRKLQIERERLISEAKKNFEKRRKTEIEKAEKKAKFKANEILAEERSATRKAQMELREKLIEKTVEAIECELQKFTETPEYSSYLSYIVERGLEQMDGYSCRIYLSERDFARYGEDVKKLVERENGIGTEVLPSESEIIGGAIFEESEKKFALDSSFSSAVEDSRSRIGLEITTILSKGGTDFGS